MTSFLTIQNTYQDIQLALFQGTQIVATASANKIAASKMLIPLAASLLSKNNTQLSELKFIAAGIGPGPYTTLRTVLASTNGLSFATHVPLIGIDALDAMIQENNTAANIPLVVLLNAFNQDVYFATQSAPSEIQKGCMNIKALLAHLAQTYPENPPSTMLPGFAQGYAGHSTTGIQFVGNGTALHKELIIETFGSRAVITNPIPEAPSIEAVGLMALAKWERQEGLAEQLMPIYLK
jgi:tRNA threonylcarbamoyl adenosine modification protein YeaZ